MFGRAENASGDGLFAASPRHKKTKRAAFPRKAALLFGNYCIFAPK
jgi:hypothetical protein